MEIQHTYTHTDPFNGPFPGLPRWAGNRKVKPTWILLKQETVGGSGISWAICKSAPRSRQITTPAPHHYSFLQVDALPAAQPTASKHWKHNGNTTHKQNIVTVLGLQCFDTVGWAAGKAYSPWKQSGGLPVWLSVWSKMQTCILPSWWADATATHCLLLH